MADNDWMRYLGTAIDKGFEGYQRGYDLELKKKAMEQDREMQRRAMKLKQAEELRNIMDSYKEIPASVRSSGMFDKDVLDAYAPEPVGLVEAPAQGLMAEPQKPSKYPNLSPEAQQIIGGEPPQAPQVAKPQGGLVQQPGFLSKFERNKLDAAMKMQNFKLNELQQQKLEQELQLAPQKRSMEMTEKQMELSEKARKSRLAGGGGSTQEKLQGLGASDKPRFDNTKMALNAVFGMEKALSSGDKTFSLMGDNNFTIAQRNFSEALGRLQSGGAIGKDEEARFKSMAPTAFDSPEIRAVKLKQLKEELGARLQTLGFKSEELGFEEGSSGPKVGQIEDGYKFKGGDPANKKNWEKVK